MENTSSVKQSCDICRDELYHILNNKTTMYSKVTFSTSLLFLFIFSSISLAQQAGKFRPGELWPDNNGVHINAHGGGMLLHEGTYYWFGEHKVAGEIGNTAQVGVHCYSSEDLYHWVDRGIALAVDSVGDIQKGCILERPKVIYNAKTKKFVMWFHLELKGQGYASARAGIAVADNVTGPFRFVRSTRATPGCYPVNTSDSLNLTEQIYIRDLAGGQMVRDQQLFVDDDGTAYHIFASEENQTLHIAELTDDYLGHTGKYVRAFEGRYMEAPALFKKDGLYYFMGSGCTGWAPNAARSAVAPSIWGPWTELGNPCVGKDAEKTFFSQSTYILPVPGEKDKFIYMGDRWAPSNPIDGRYIWLPIRFEGRKFKIAWVDEWAL